MASSRKVKPFLSADYFRHVFRVIRLGNVSRRRPGSRPRRRWVLFPALAQSEETSAFTTARYLDSLNMHLRVHKKSYD